MKGKRFYRKGAKAAKERKAWVEKIKDLKVAEEKWRGIGFASLCGLCAFAAKNSRSYSLS
jgi:hypothetical protein|tara:strand:- start:40515 stop:40694 length:180 start_codon:yes stop_codon:yes gene_type:complete